MKVELIDELCNIDGILDGDGSKIKKIVNLIKEATNTTDTLNNLVDAAQKVKDHLLDKLESKNTTNTLVETAHNLFCGKNNKTDFFSIFENKTILPAIFNNDTTFPSIFSKNNKTLFSSIFNNGTVLSSIFSNKTLFPSIFGQDADVNVEAVLDLAQYLDVFQLIGQVDVEDVDPRDVEDLLYLEDLLESEEVEDLRGLSRAFGEWNSDAEEITRNKPFFVTDVTDDKDKDVRSKCKGKINQKLKKCKNKKSKGQLFLLFWDFLDEEQGWHSNRKNFLVMTFTCGHWPVATFPYELRVVQGQ